MVLSREEAWNISAKRDLPNAVQVVIADVDAYTHISRIQGPRHRA